MNAKLITTALAVLGGTVAVSALEVIDFTDAAWALPNNTTVSKTVAGTTATATSVGGSLPVYLSQSAANGLGINTTTIDIEDEIQTITVFGSSYVEILTVDLAPGKYATGASIKNLFRNANETGFADEKGVVELWNNGFLQITLPFQADATSSSGNLFVSFGGGYDALKFYAQETALFTISDFSVASLNVPDGGSSLVLLGLGLVGVGALRRRLA